MPDIAFKQANPAEFAKTIFRGWQTSARWADAQGVCGRSAQDTTECRGDWKTRNI
jgi:hypothetical protein